MKTLEKKLQKKISIVVPCYNESEVLQAFNERLSKVLIELQDYIHEVIYVDDGSSDNTYRILEGFKRESDCINIISFSRNFGHQIAITAGIETSTGDAVIIIDADLQDPPELIKEMISIWLEGVDVVYAVRNSRNGESKFKILTAKYFYKLIYKLSDIKIPINTGDFRLMDRKVVDIFCSMAERDRYVRGMISWIGFIQRPIFYDRDIRFAGKTKYTFLKMMNFALDGLISFSKKPLQIATLIGIFSFLLSILGVLYSLFMRFTTDNWVPGWTLMFIAVLLIGGLQLVFLGLIGEYIGRIYGESKKRPLYIKNESK